MNDPVNWTLAKILLSNYIFIVEHFININCKKETCWEGTSQPAWVFTAFVTNSGWKKQLPHSQFGALTLFFFFFFFLYFCCFKNASIPSQAS